ncbi:MAG: nucleotide sugar dehydrogenase [Planctomycetaceae bacterium]
MPTASTFENLQAKLQNKTATLGVVGLGYVGLPLVRTFVDAGYFCLGFDCDQRKVERLKRGESYIGHISAEWIASCIGSQKFEPTSDMARLGEADVIIICVPTPLSESRDPDLTYIESTAAQISATLRPGQLVILESTTYPGTTRDVLLPILQRGNNLKVGSDFFVAYSPEREDPGNASFSTKRIPKVVGGMDSDSQQLAILLYSSAVVQVVAVDNCEIAEACKILENVYRAVNIAMVNELKMLFDRLDLDIWKVIEAAKSKPFGFQPFYPGPGLGGHCIPIDPFYLSWLARKHESSTRFIELAGEINSFMPHYVIEKLAEALNDLCKPIRGSKIAILGVAYKKDVDDPRESPAFKLMELLEERGASLSYHDPFIPTLPSMRSFKVPNLSSEPLTAEYLADQDCVLIVTDHTQVDYAHVVKHSQMVLDTRNCTRHVTDGAEKIRRA